jgi:hypothetical protein
VSNVLHLHAEMATAARRQELEHRQELERLRTDQQVSPSPPSCLSRGALVRGASSGMRGRSVAHAVRGEGWGVSLCYQSCRCPLCKNCHRALGGRVPAADA